MIRNLLTRSSEQFKTDFERLLRGETVKKIIDEHVVFGDLSTEDVQTAWSLLLMAGYLKVISQHRIDDGLYATLTIPNREVRNRYQQIIKRWLAAKQGIEWFNQLLDHLLTGQLQDFEVGFNTLMQQTVSVHDMSKEPEAFYHGLMIGLTASLYGDPNYELRSNRESGYGFYDYLILSKDLTKPTLVIELKRFNTEKALKRAALMQRLKQEALKALTQLNQQQYISEAKQRGVTHLIKIGLAFCGKHFKMVHEQEKPLRS